MLDDPESDDAVAERCKRLRIVMEYAQSSAFAKFLGVSPQRWNNVEIGMPLSRDLAMTLVRKIPGLTLDWLYRDRSEGLPLDFARRLDALAPSNIKQHVSSRRPR